MKHAPRDITRILPLLPALVALSLQGGQAQDRRVPTAPPRIDSTPLRSTVPPAHRGWGSGALQETDAQEQGQTADDIETTRRIRRSIVDDDSLSTYARNVKIVSRNGEVTLRGPVRSARERAVIEQRAVEAGGGRVRNELEIVPGKTIGR